MEIPLQSNQIELHVPEWDKRLECWTIPWKCPCCTKCRLRANSDGFPIMTRDKWGRNRYHCVYGGPFEGYMEEGFEG